MFLDVTDQGNNVVFTGLDHRWSMPLLVFQKVSIPRAPIVFQRGARHRPSRLSLYHGEHHPYILVRRTTAPEFVSSMACELSTLVDGLVPPSCQTKA